MPKPRRATRHRLCRARHLLWVGQPIRVRQVRSLLQLKQLVLLIAAAMLFGGLGPRLLVGDGLTSYPSIDRLLAVRRWWKGSKPAYRAIVAVRVRARFQP